LVCRSQIRGDDKFDKFGSTAMTQSDSNAAGRAKILAATVAVGNPARSTDLMHAWNLTAREPGDPSTVSIGERSAILPSPNRSVRYKDVL